jgi:uncharacterized protein (TIGR00251 family)
MAGTVFSARVSAGKGSFSVALSSESPPAIKAQLRSPPQGGRANRELVLGLEKMLGCRVRLLTGAASRKKTLAAECGREEFVGKVRISDEKQG